MVDSSPKNKSSSYRNIGPHGSRFYNDSKTLTLAAWSWPSRSLAQLHANRQCQIYDVDNDFSLVPSTKLHYRDPVHCNEMLKNQGDFERSNLKEELINCLKFLVQMDGTVDTKQHDNKFIFIRFNTRKNPLDIKTRFVSAKTSDSRGGGALRDYSIILCPL